MFYIVILQQRPTVNNPLETIAKESEETE